MINDSTQLRQLLQTTRRIAVVGLSARPDRPSNEVARYLIAHGYTVIPVNPACTQVLGLPCYPSLRDIPGGVDMVDVFRRSEEVAAVVDDAIAIGARSLWLQLRVIDVEAAQRAQATGMKVVMDRCIKIDHGHLFAERDRNAGAATTSTPPDQQ